MPIVPPSLLFRYTFAAPRIDALPRARPPLLGLPDSCLVPFPSRLDGAAPYAQLRMAWNRDGLGVSLAVTGKQAPPVGDPAGLDASDGLWLWLDTRDTQSIHRASRFCHLFALVPTGGGKQGDHPFARQLPVPRAREDAPLVDPGLIALQTVARDDGYLMEAWIPADVLHGYDPQSQPRLGFYALVQDQELGRQFLTVGDDFPYSSDPSLWSSLELSSSG